MFSCNHVIYCVFDIPGTGHNHSSTGIVTSLTAFDHEEQMEYHMPIVMRDSGLPPAVGTSTLTIIIGDVNDTKHYPG